MSKFLEKISALSDSSDQNLISTLEHHINDARTSGLSEGEDGETYELLEDGNVLITDADKQETTCITTQVGYRFQLPDKTTFDVPRPGEVEKKNEGTYGDMFAPKGSRANVVTFSKRPTRSKLFAKLFNLTDSALVNAVSDALEQGTSSLVGETGEIYDVEKVSDSSVTITSDTESVVGTRIEDTIVVSESAQVIIPLDLSESPLTIEPEVTEPETHAEPETPMEPEPASDNELNGEPEGEPEGEPVEPEPASDDEEEAFCKSLEMNQKAFSQIEDVKRVIKAIEELEKSGKSYNEDDIKKKSGVKDDEAVNMAIKTFSDEN